MIGRCKSKWKTARETVEEIRADLNPFFNLLCGRISSHVFFGAQEPFEMSRMIRLINGTNAEAPLFFKLDKAALTIFDETNRCIGHRKDIDLQLSVGLMGAIVDLLK